MNRHFQRNFSTEWQLPSKVYARLDHVERHGPGDSILLLAFDAVDANWLVGLAQVGDRRFDLDWPDRALAELTARPPLPALQQSFFEDAPLYRIEIDHPLGQSLFTYGRPDFVDTGRADSGLAALESAWFILNLTQHEVAESSPASVYPALFAQPTSAYVTGTMPSVQQGRALSKIFSLATLPVVTTPQLAAKLAVAEADILAVYDVGQGNSNALLLKNQNYAVPTLYYDLGAGVYRNKHTTPANLVFCFTRHPLILLSHWDADHWAGTYATSIAGAYPALQQDWVAPMQATGPVHTAFAHDVISAGGSMSTYAPTAGTIGSSTLASARKLRFALGTGSDRNNTGIVVAVEDDALVPQRSWLLTGDCDYQYFILHLNPHAPVGLVAPHHGADLASGVSAPAPVILLNGYRRLAYSFGAGNKHGSKQHPTPIGMKLHTTPNWNHGGWNAASPGFCIAASDVLHTEMHGSLGVPARQLGGCLIGWDGIPLPVTPPCAIGALGGLATCTISPVQR